MINSLLVYLGLSTVEHISQSSGIYSRIPADTPDNFNILLVGALDITHYSTWMEYKNTLSAI